MNILETTEYMTIKRFYGYSQAVRSGVKLMNHIDEGLVILDRIGASDEAKMAYCIHPIVQSDETSCGWSDVHPIAEEYAEKANSYLCRPDTDYIKTVSDVHSVVKGMTKDCRDMLLADKLQNRADFYKYHYGSHDRYVELDQYFGLWIEYLNSSLWKDVVDKNKFYLLKFRKNWADEFTVEGFLALTGNELSFYREMMKDIGTFSFSFGTNEGWGEDYGEETGAEVYESSFTEVEITSEEYNVLKRLFPSAYGTKFGIIPDLIDVEENKLSEEE